MIVVEQRSTHCSLSFGVYTGQAINHLQKNIQQKFKHGTKQSGLNRCHNETFAATPSAKVK